MLPTFDCDLWLYLQGIFLFALAQLLQPTIISPPSVFCFVFFFFFLNAAVFVVSVIRQQNSGADEALAALTPPPQTRRHRRSAGQRRVLLGTQSYPEHPDVAELLGLHRSSSAAR